MSPVSRGRRRKHATVRRPRRVPAEPTLDEMHAQLVGAFAPLVHEEDPLRVEVFASGLQGTWWQRLPAEEDPDAAFGLGSAGYAARRRTPEAIALLRAWAAVGVTAEQRAASAAAARDLAEAGVADPAWAARIGDVEVGECWRLGDVFGDQTTLFCTYGYGGRRHGLAALIDVGPPDGWVKDLFITDDPDDALSRMRQQVTSSPLTVLEPLEPAEARRRLEAALHATDQMWDPEVGDEFRTYRALALARCRAMPRRDHPTPAAAGYDQPARATLVAEFLAADAAAHLPDTEATRYCARLIVDFGVDHDGGRPLRVSPAKCDLFTRHWVPAAAILDEDDLAGMPAVLAAWVRWAAPRTGLPEAAIAEVTRAAEECGEGFAEAYQAGAADSPARMLLRGVDPSAGAADVREVLDRRQFVTPYFGTRIGDEDYPHLDPGDPDERHLLIEGEHAEYHEALADPGSDVEVDGVNPRLHIALHEIVASQLWDDDPPEAWSAAKRMRDAGMERHDILHRLAGVATEFVYAALTTREPINRTEYCQALDDLPGDDLTGEDLPDDALPGGGRLDRRSTGRSTARRPRPAGTGAEVYQVKIELRDCDPPIWRRLRLPATTRLATLHTVIQAAFGWQDSHLHSFTAAGRRYSAREFDLEYYADERKKRLRDVAPEVGDRFTYTYDFGDCWEHEIVVEEIGPPDGVQLARCVTGGRAAPPEDCGGVLGYAELCEVLADPEHPEHGERVEWLGYRHDPAAFDADAVNEILAGIRLG